MSYSVLDTKKIIDVVKYRWVWFLLSAILLLPGIFAMGYSMIKYPTHTPLMVGIDFTGGTIVQYAVSNDVPSDKVEQLRTNLLAKDIDNPVIQVLSPSATDREKSIKHLISIKTKFAEDNQTEQTQTLTTAVTELYPEAQLVQSDSVGPVLGKQLFINSMIAVTLALLGIIIYLTLRFHFEFALAAILALIHDMIFVLGVFSILGLFFGTHIDSLFVTAILTVLGFSVHDTIVVFDRIRENVKFYSKKATYNELVNASVNQTLARSINTSLTTLLTLGALYFFGGVTTRDFVLVMILGIFIGTYSSIFFASTLVAMWNESKTTNQQEG
ncbi:protein translocase subunit SecF [bacterium]|nr:protein translocase subunit SecF [bacterium]